MLVPFDEKNTPEESARAVRDKALAEINQHVTKFVPYSKDWTAKTHSLNVYFTGIQKGLTNAQLYLLAQTKQLWDELDLEFRMEYHNDFWFYACLMTGRQQKRLEDLIGAIEVFVLEEKKPLGTIGIPKRDEKGSIVPNEIEYRQFDPLEIDPGKLAALRSVAAKGHMNTQLWSMLVDEQISVTEIQLALMGDGGGAGKVADTSMKFDIEGPYLLVRENGVAVVLGELGCWDAYYDDVHSLEHRAMRRLFAMFNIKMDDEVLRDKELRLRRTGSIKVKNEAQGES
jgi:hypothetical protein